MIPTEDLCLKLWDKYNLSGPKRIHVRLVAIVAGILADGMQHSKSGLRTVNMSLLTAAALLHDIDKNIPKREGETHPAAAVRILRQEAMDEVADIVATHPLHAILNPRISPKTFEEKLLYLADKSVKFEFVGVDGRFALWNAEEMRSDATRVLTDSYPLVKKLEREIYTLAGITEAALRQEITRRQSDSSVNNCINTRTGI